MVRRRLKKLSLIAGFVLTIQIGYEWQSGSVHATSFARWTDTVAATYTWTEPKWVITEALMGVTIDEFTFAGVNSGGFIDAAGNLRIIFGTGKGATTKVSAISRDGGATFTVDAGFRFPSGLREGLGHISVTTAAEGGYRAYLRDDLGILSVKSLDGQTWTLDPGYRVLVSSLGISKVDGGAVVKLPSGQYRMFIGDESDYFKTCGSTRPVSTKILSATSPDQLNFTVDTGYRIGTEITDLCKLHPHAFLDSNGDVVVVMHINNNIAQSRSEWMGSCFFARSKDGSTFPTLERIPVLSPVTRGGEMYAGDCDVVVMPDKTLRLFFSNSGKIGMAIGTPVTSASASNTVNSSLPKVGQICSQLGKRVTINKVRLVCKKVGSTKKWAKG